MKRYLLLVFLLVVSGCENSSNGGGFLCPLNPPSCCYNSLFGCGTFDLPDGCSCSDYFGLSSFQKSSSLIPHSLRSNRALSVKDFKGNYSGNVSKVSSTCAGAPQNLKNTIQINESRGKISFTVPGYGVIRGTSISGKFRAHGALTNLSSLGIATLNVTGTKVSATTATAKIDFQYRPVLFGSSCAASYIGTLRKK